MIDTPRFFSFLQSQDVLFYTGVPDSLLKSLGNCFFDNLENDNHIIAANEGNAIAIAAGYYVASQKIPLVYLQNSGLGNTINPLLSLSDNAVYGIPMIIFVGWRGKDGKNDAEQHLKQGLVTVDIITAMQYPYIVLSTDEQQACEQVRLALKKAHEDSTPYFVVVEEGTFTEYTRKEIVRSISSMKREEALRIIAENIKDDYFVVSTTGKTSRELFEVREQLKQRHDKDFLTVGSMGHTSSIAYGMALGSGKDIICIDGDGSLLMHMGALAVINNGNAGERLKYIVINNASHESVGGLPTPIKSIDFQLFFRSVGFDHYFFADTQKSLSDVITSFLNVSGATVLEVLVQQGSRKDLARPSMKAGELKHVLMHEFIKARGV